MDTKVEAFFVGVGIGMILGLILLSTFGINPLQTAEKYQAEIIEHGYGEYYISEDHEIEFRWLESEGTER